MRALLAGLAVALIAFGGVGVAAGGKIKSATEVEVVTVIQRPPDNVVVGALTADKRKCVGRRKVEVSFNRQAGGSFAFGTGRTSPGGDWEAARATSEVISQGPFTSIEAKARKRVVRVKGKKLICRSDKTLYPLTD